MRSSAHSRCPNQPARARRMVRVSADLSVGFVFFSSVYVILYMHLIMYTFTADMEGPDQTKQMLVLVLAVDASISS